MEAELQAGTEMSGGGPLAQNGILAAPVPFITTFLIPLNGITEQRFSHPRNHGSLILKIIVECHPVGNLSYIKDNSAASIIGH